MEEEPFQLELPKGFPDRRPTDPDSLRDFGALSGLEREVHDALLDKGINPFH